MAPQKIEEDNVNYENGSNAESLESKLEKVRHHQNSKLPHQHRVSEE